MAHAFKGKPGWKCFDDSKPVHPPFLLHLSSPFHPAPQIGTLPHHQIGLTSASGFQLYTFSHSLHASGQLPRGEVEFLGKYQVE